MTRRDARPLHEDMTSPQTPSELREGVRAGIVDALREDAELRGPRTARLLVMAGALGIFGAVGILLVLSGHPYGHHPPWHVVLFSAAWAGLLVVAIALALLRVRTASLPIARAVFVGIVGLGVAGLCSVLCPDPHFLAWWDRTPVGDALGSLGGPALGALCFGVVTTAFFGLVAAVAAARGRGRDAVTPLLPAAVLVVLLAPGIALQSFGRAWLVSAAWLLGAFAGAYAGIAFGLFAGRRPPPG
jgi:hypothetical protein